jgi:hypothetical protein
MDDEERQNFIRDLRASNKTKLVAAREELVSRQMSQPLPDAGLAWRQRASKREQARADAKAELARDTEERRREREAAELRTRASNTEQMIRAAVLQERDFLVELIASALNDLVDKEVALVKQELAECRATLRELTATMKTRGLDANRIAREIDAKLN